LGRSPRFILGRRKGVQYLSWEEVQDLSWEGGKESKIYLGKESKIYLGKEERSPRFILDKIYLGHDNFGFIIL
jgi:hypothetical protein